MATYPDGIWSAPARGVNMSDAVTQTDILDAQNAEIIAIQNELGIQPSGSSLTVKARLDALTSTVASNLSTVNQAIEDLEEQTEEAITDALITALDAASAASSAAAAANSNANGRVSKSGDSMTGGLQISTAAFGVRVRRDDAAAYEMYDGAGSVRYGFLQGASTFTRLVSDTDLTLLATGTKMNFVVDAIDQRMTIDNTLVLIGKTSSDESVSGVLLGADSQGGHVVSSVSSNGLANLTLRREGSANANGQQFAVFKGGASVLGSITRASASTVAFNTTSDYRLKDDLGPIDDPLDVIGRLRPRHLAWRATGEEFDGFLAHEVAEVVPQAVTGEKDAVDDNGDIVPQQLDHSKLVPLLVAAVQQLAAEVAELKARL